MRGANVSPTNQERVIRTSDINYTFKGEQLANMIASSAWPRRPDHKKAEVLSEDDLKQLRHNLAHLSIGAVRDFYDQAYRDCRLIYHRLPSPKQMQMLVQAWKQLWKWR
ncbi:MAG: hypothetical protein WB814_13785 [Candidatus Sulfotelmatobacter sp.]